MRVAIVDVRRAAVRSVVAETTSRGPRRVLDRTVAVGLSRVLGTEVDGAALAGAADVLRETARRFGEGHRRLGVSRVVLTVDGELREPLAASGLVAELADILGADVLPGDVDGEARALARAATHHGVLDDRPALLVELGHDTARVALVELGAVRAAARVPMRQVDELAAVARTKTGDGWIDVAVAVVTPLLTAVPLPAEPGEVRIVVAGAPAQALARAVASRDWRHPLRAVDRVRVTAPAVLALTGELGAEPGDHARAGLDAGDAVEAAGVAVVLSGLLAVTGAAAVRTTDADRVEGRLLELLRTTGPCDLATRVVEAVGDPTPHSAHVARLAVRLFDGLAETVGLAPADRHVLEAAALVHDIARADGAGHHRRGAERVLGLPVRCVSPGTLVEVACVVRSQRGRPPGSHVPVFLRLPPPRRRVVEALVALLRLAEGLDRGADGAVRALLVSVDRAPRGRTDTEPLVCVDAIGDRLDLALYGARGQARYAERALGIRLVVRAGSALSTPA